MEYKTLAAYLTPEQYDQLDQEGTLPAEIRVPLAVRLRRELSACAAYIPTRLLQTHMHHPQPARINGEYWQGSILFADLSGFTTFCEQLSALGKQGAEEVSTVVNQLFNELVAEVLPRGSGQIGGGELLKFGGDALTAFFDADVFGHAHAAVAVHAALRMQQRMAAFTAVETRVGTFRLGIRIGVHSGTIFAAEVGDYTHIELVVTGADMNLVALAQSLAMTDEVIVTEQTAKLLEGATLLPCPQAGFAKVVDIPKPPSLPSPKSLPVYTGDDLDSLIQLAQQIQALHPYLMHDLPRRYLDSTATDIGELRPVSVLFANFYDFSALLQYFDEDAGLAASALNAYISRVQTVVHRYGGIINKVDMYTKGDKLMALFGAPVAHEDDPLRAVHCAMELDTALEEANAEIGEILADASIHSLKLGESPLVEPSPLSPTLLQHSIGINTGTVFAGRVGGSRRYEYTVMGPAVNLAARLMESAAPSTILISPETRSVVERHVVLFEQEPMTIKGIEEPITASRVVQQDEELAPSEDKRTTRSPLVGRDPELTLMLAEAKVALRESGRTLVLVGEAGVGKTRLTNELIRSLVMASVSDDTAEVVPHFQIYTGSGSSLSMSMPYSLLRTPLQHVLGFTMRRLRSQTVIVDEALMLRLQHRVEQLAPEYAHFLPILGDVLGVDLPETAITKSLSVEQRYNRIQDLVVALFIGVAKHEPMVMVLDDIQWADASSQDLITRLAKAVSSAPLLLVLSYRPDQAIKEEWLSIPTTRRQDLSELTPQESSVMIGGILHGPPPPDILDLLKRTQGNPFFIEELVHALVDSGTLAKDEQGQWHLTCPPDQVSVPTSIEGLIMARLDRLDEPYQQLVQIASVIGHRFTLQVLDGVYRDSSLLMDGIQRLIETDILMMDENPREVTYLFRHALLHDIAYESILYAQRRELHRRVAQRIEELNTGHLDEHLALLARHYLLAEDWLVSFRFHLSAGIQAQDQYANQEALSLFATALDIAPRLKRAGEQDTTTQPLTSGSGTTHDIFPLLAPMYPTILQVAELYERMGYVYMRIGEYHRAHKPFMDSLRLTNRLNEEMICWDKEQRLFPVPHSQLSIMTVRLHRHLATLQEQLANYDMAFDWLERGMAMVTSESQSELARCYLLGSRIYYSQGEFDKALYWAQQGLSVAESIGNTIDQAHASLLMGILWRDRGEFDLSIPALEQARTLLDLMKDATYLSDALRNLGDAYFATGRWKDATKSYQKSLQISENVGDVLGTAHASTSLAGLMAGRGEIALASDLYQYSREQFKRIGSVVGLAITDYHLGEMLLMQDDPEQALPCLLESMEALEQVKARNYIPKVLYMIAETSLLLGDDGQAQTYISRSMRVARELGMAVDEAIGYRVLGQIALYQEHYAAAETHLKESRKRLQAMNHRYEMAKVLFLLAKTLIASGRDSQATQLLWEAESIFNELKAKRDVRLITEYKASIGM